MIYGIADNCTSTEATADERQNPPLIDHDCAVRTEYMHTK